MSHGCNWVPENTLAKQSREWRCVWCDKGVRMALGEGKPKLCHMPMWIISKDQN